MTTYNSYEEAKIANPDENIQHLDGKLFVSENSGVPYERRHDWLPANPADYCMTVEKFLADGHKFVEGDCYLNSNGVSIGLVNIPWVNNNPSDLDSKLFILRAAALETQMNIDNLATQTPEEKEALDLINTTPHQYEMSKFSGNEWNGEGLPPVGVECEAVFIEHEHKGYGEFLALGYHGNYVWLEYIGELPNKSKHYTAKIDLVKFRKQETLQQREERERLEAAYDLYCEWCIAMRYPKFSFEQFTACERDKAGMLAIVDKTNYRKESN